MAETRKGEVTFKGNPITLVGPKLKPGDKAPDFTAVGAGLAKVSLADTAGKARLFNVVPSLDTPVCNKQTKRFAQELKALGDKVAAYTVSTDLPFAQARFCTEANIDNIKNLSDAHNHSFGEHYGVFINDLPVPLLARCGFCGRPVQYDSLRRDRARDRPGTRLRAGPQSPEGSGRRMRPVSRPPSPAFNFADRRQSWSRPTAPQSSGLIQMLRYSTGLPWSWSMSGPSWPAATLTPPGVIEISALSMVLISL